MILKVGHNSATYFFRMGSVSLGKSRGNWNIPYGSQTKRKITVNMHEFLNRNSFRSCSTADDPDVPVS